MVLVVFYALNYSIIIMISYALRLIGQKVCVKTLITLDIY